MKFYKEHLAECPKRPNIMKTILVEGIDGKGSEFKEDLEWAHLGNFDLYKINMEFSRKIKNYGYSNNYNSLSSIQLFFRKKQIEN